jgi:hypothetical protein
MILVEDTQLDYNLYWNNPEGDVLGASVGANAIHADPLFVAQSAGDMALGLHSPALDSGDPDVRFADRDGTKNDRGGFGGPDAASRAPAPPAALRVTATAEGNELSWTLGGEVAVDFVAVYRDTDSTFAPSQSNFLVSVSATHTEFLDVDASAGLWYRLAAVEASGAASGFHAAVRAEASTGIVDPDNGNTAPTSPPHVFVLHPNEPNPFNPATRIHFDLPRSAHVRVEILDTRGRLVRRLADRVLPAGTAIVFWDGRDGRGLAMPSGIYLYRITAGRWVAARKMTLLR